MNENERKRKFQLNELKATLRRNISVDGPLGKIAERACLDISSMPIPYNFRRNNSNVTIGNCNKH